MSIRPRSTRIVETYETKIGPHIGARSRRQGLGRSGLQGALLDDATAAIADRSAM